MENFIIQEVLDIKENAKFHVMSEGKIVGLMTIEDENISVYKNSTKETESFGSSVKRFMEYVRENNYMFKKISGEAWVEWNPNPDGKKTIDCSIRAYCKAEGMAWEEAYDLACRLGKEHSDMPNSNTNCERIVREEFGYNLLKLKKEEKKTVKEWALEHPTGIYIMFCRGHLVTIDNGKYYDTWDSGDKKFSKVYERPVTEI